MPNCEVRFQNRTEPDLHEGASKRILVIDDEEDILELLRDELGKRGYETVVASNGEAGLSHLSQRDFDLIFCDWKMPGMSGREVYERIGVIKPELRQRLVVVTGDILSNQTYLFLQMEKLPYIVKPFSLPEVHSIIRMVLNPRPRSDSGDTARWKS
jgi:two-component system, OmpR family, alkaline phosphatase synthesis response regulator PhoP